MSEKIIGYILLVVGIMIILTSAISTYSVYTKKNEPVKLFSFRSISLNTNEIIAANLPVEMSGLLAQQPTQVQQTELIPAEMLNETTNVFAHLFLMGFIASVGYKIATLGTQLIRPIVVKMRTNEDRVTIDK